MATQSLRRLAAILIPLLVTGIFAFKTHLLSGGFYSSDVNYRYQTNALLLGHLALRDSPAQHLHDWAWNDGAHQVFGLGVPLLRLPFEAVARIFHQSFPDRLVFLLLHFVTGVAIITAAWGVESIFLPLSALILFLLNPHLLQLVGGNRFYVYEEAIAYNVLWAVLGLVLALKCMTGPVPAKGRGRPLWLIFAFVAGFSILIRPTGFLWGSLSFMIFLWHRRKAGVILGPACALFLTGPLLALLTNELRFGTPWSFGHPLALMDRPALIYSMRWGYPFQSEPFFRAARELFGGLWMDSDISKWRSVTDRYREFYFRIDYHELLVLAGLACLIPFISRFKRVARVASINLLLLWAVGSFSVLFLFYLRFNAMTSRYLAEFIPSIYAALVVGVIYLFGVIQAFPPRLQPPKLCRLVFFALLASELLFTPGLGNARKEDSVRSSVRYPANVTAAQVEKKVASWSFPQPMPPDEYHCGMSNPNGQIPYNGLGWNISGICGVSETTILFFDHLECLELTYHSGIAPTVRVAAELEDWKQVLDKQVGKKTVKLFCPGQPDFAHYKYSSIKLVVIGWVKPQELDSGRQSQLRLDSVRNASWPL